MASVLGLARRVLARAVQRDGTATTVQAEALATGVAQAAALAAELPEGRAAGPRRVLAPPAAQVQEALAQKVLAGWIQNRHQTLYPLAMNFRAMPAGAVALLVQAAAAALHAGGPPGTAAVDRVRDWLGTVGATDGQRQALAEAVAQPRPLHELLDMIASAHLGPQAFAVALGALDQRPAVNRLFLDYLAARLAIPGDVARSLAQRYRL